MLKNIDEIKLTIGNAVKSLYQMIMVFSRSQVSMRVLTILRKQKLLAVTIKFLVAQQL